ncbi:MAG: alpha-amylase family glycosyl hydrolase [Flavobacteriales bacterium]
MKAIHLLALAALFFAACSNEFEPQNAVRADYIFGLASPIRLETDTTEVFLNDFFTALDTVPVVVFLGDTLRVDEQRMTVQLTEQPLNAVGVLEVLYKDAVHHIPVFKNEKERVVFAYTPEKTYNEVALAGSLNGWNPKATPLSFTNGRWETELVLSPGEWEYQLVVDGDWMLDPNNALQRSNGQGGMNSVLVVGDPTAVRPVVRAVSSNQSEIALEATPNAVLYAFWQNRLIMNGVAVDETGTTKLYLPSDAKLSEHSHVRIYSGTQKQRGGDVLIPLHFGALANTPQQLAKNDAHKLNMYFILTDRFADGNPNNNFPVNDLSIHPKANHHGGDFDGILQKLQDGYFDELGVNTLWLSPITTNAAGAWGLWDKGVASKFSGYHGYWPVRSREIDRNFGNHTSFTELIDRLHARDMYLLVDYVANHVHQDHPVIQANPDWATPLYLPDGSMNTERWDEYRLTTWFDTFLPTLDLERQEVTEAMTDTAMYWVTEYAIDGFRHDATKHIPTQFWRTLTNKARAHLRASNPDRMLFQIGETYGNPELIGSYINSGMLDAQFDFNLYDAAVDALAKPETGFQNLARVIRESLVGYGNHHLMGNISGNQDRARFISYADGSVRFDEDPKLAGWTREITHQGGDSYDRLIQLHALNLTLPGVPCVYYGDEIALPGANDPDNRRMMRFENLTSDELKVRAAFSELAKLRNQRMSLLYGSTSITTANDSLFVMERSYLNERTVLVLSKQSSIPSIDSLLQIAGDGRFYAVFGN